MPSVHLPRGQAADRFLRVLQRALVWLVALAVTAPGGAVFGQCVTGAFYPLDSWFIASSGTVGLAVEDNGATIRIDANGDGVIQPTERAHPMPAPLAPPFTASATLRVSPTRRYLYATGGQSASGCSGVTVRLYRLPNSNNSTPVLLHEVCLPNVLRSNIFFDGQLFQSGPEASGGSGVPFAGLLHQPAPGGNLTLTLLSLANQPSPPRVDITPLRPGVGDIRVARGGQALYVQHDLSSPSSTDYTVVSTCLATFGQVLNPAGVPLANVSGGPLDAELLTAASGVSPIRFTQSGTPFAALSAPDCCAAPPPVGQAALAVSSTVATIATPPQVPVQYTISVSNPGTVAASTVVVTVDLPIGNVTFDSASDNGQLVGNSVRWELATLPSGASVGLTLTLVPQCAPAPYVANLRNVRASAANAPVVGFSPPLDRPAVQVPPTDPLTVSATLTPDAGTPVRPGDSLTATITLANTLAQPRTQLRFASPVLAIGSNLEIEQVLATSAGSSTLDASGLSWEGDLPASGSATITLRLRLAACLPVGSVSTRISTFLQIVNSCQALVLSQFISTPAIPVLPDLQLAIALGPISPGTIGPAAQGRQAVRVGTPLQLTIGLQSTATGGVMSTQTRLVLPPELSVASPVFAAPVPPGAAYDPVERTITLDADLAAGAAATAVVNLIAPSPAVRARLLAESGRPGCVSARAELTVCPVPEVPTGPTLYGLRSIEGVWMMRLGIDTAPVPFFGGSFGGNFGFDALPGGDMWIASEPIVRFNPVTLNLQYGTDPVSFPNGTLGAGGIYTLDAVIDPASSNVYFSGSGGSGYGARVVRYDPAVPLAANVSTDFTSLSVAGSAILTSSGLLVCNGPSNVDISSGYRGLLRPVIGPNAPVVNFPQVPAVAAPQPMYTFTPPGVRRPTYPVAIAPRNALTSWVVLCSEWNLGSLLTPQVRTRVYALAIFDNAASTFTVVVDVLAHDQAISGNGTPTALPTPLIPANLSFASFGNRGVSLAPGLGGSLLLASRSTLYRIDSPEASPVVTVLVANFLNDPTGFNTNSDLVALGTLNATPVGCNPADITGIGGPPTPPDGTLTGDDFHAFINAFAAADALADIVSIGGLPPPDGLLTGDDFNAFIAAFAAGCP